MELVARATCGQALANGQETHYVTLTFVAPQAPAGAERTPVNLALALDRSGSMAGRKLELARDAVGTSLRMLRAADRSALVVFDHELGVVAGSAPVTEESRRHALAQLAGVAARGNTNLEAGWQRAAGEALPFAGPGVTSRVIVVTDGQANAGIIAPNELMKLAAELRVRGIATSTLGIGTDFNETLLQGMAEHGGGNFYYVENTDQIVDMLSGEIGETLEVVVRRPAVDVLVPAGATATLLERFACTPLVGGFRASLDDLTSNQLVQLCFEVTLPAAAVGETIELQFTLRAGEDAAPVASTSVGWRMATEEQLGDAPRDPEVEAQVAGALSARMQHEALEHNRGRRYGEARGVTTAMAAQLRRLSSTNPQVNAIADALDEDVRALGEPMDPRELKRRHFTAHAAARGRDEQGHSRKGDK